MVYEKEQTPQNYYKGGLREVIEGTKGIEFGSPGILIWFDSCRDYNCRFWLKREGLRKFGR